jgi:nucleotide-binding universal stress UspA family protein
MQPHRILCAIDFSDASRAALRTAAQLALQRAATLVLVHVTEAPLWAHEPYTHLPNEITLEMIAAERRTLDEWKHDAQQLGVPEVVAKHADGNPWEMIVSLANADPAVELVVVATHGRKGMSRALLGSVAERVVRHAPCSVLVVRPRAASKVHGGQT